jgi:hypothetical protein
MFGEMAGLMCTPWEASGVSVGQAKRRAENDATCMLLPSRLAPPV